MADREAFAAEVPGGRLAGWVSGAGPPVLYLHGGPGIRYDSMDLLAVAELESESRVAIFQQRGLDPSTTEGPFTMSQAVADVVAVLDALDWSTAVIVGHSWGAHLALRVAAAHPQRLHGVLTIEGLGIVDDGGRAAFQTEMFARVPRAGRERLSALKEIEQTRKLSFEEESEAQGILWPSYFADPDNVPPPPPFAACSAAFEGLISEVDSRTEAVVEIMGSGAVRCGVLAGGASPVPWGQAARQTSELSPNAFLKVIPAAGHFVWYEAPGSVLSALRRLMASTQVG